jgi:flagellar P-ring protein precursor FlgI
MRFFNIIFALTLTASAGAQGTVPATAPVDSSTAAGGQEGNLATVLPLGGGIEAPTQPQGVSTANYSRTARVRPISRTGGNYEAKIASPLSSLFRVRGVQENEVNGIGIVMGLDATGDSGLLAPQLLANSLLASNINIDPKLLATSSIATVHVKGVIPHGAKPGSRMDVIVSTLGDAESLYGGNLLITELMDIEGNNVYATASGSLTVGGFFAAGSAASTTKNHVTVGTLASAGRVQMGIDASVVNEHGYIYLDAKNGQGSFGNTVRATDAINRLYPETAQVLPDGKSVRFKVMDGVPSESVVAYLDSAMQLEVETDNLARVVISERTGVIVMGGNVRLRPGVIQHGSIVVTIAETPEVSQPAGFSNGVTTEVPRTNLNVVEGDAPLVLMGGATSLEEVVEVLNVLGATPRDMIAIMESLVSGGLLVADLKRM